MALIQIEESELKLLRDERDAARKAADDEKAAHQETQRKVEETETKLKTTESERETAKQETAKLQELADQTKLADARLGTLGTGFTAKLGDFTKQRLNEQAKTYSDQEWDDRLKELEEQAAVKRDDKGDSTPATPPAPGSTESASSNGSPVFTEEELAKLRTGTTGQPPTTGGEFQSPAQRRSVASGLAKTFKK